MKTYEKHQRRDQQTQGNGVQISLHPFNIPFSHALIKLQSDFKSISCVLGIEAIYLDLEDDSSF